MPRKLTRERTRVDTKYNIRELDLDNIPSSRNIIRRQGMSCLIDKDMYHNPIIKFETNDEFSKNVV